MGRASPREPPDGEPWERGRPARKTYAHSRRRGLYRVDAGGTPALPGFTSRVSACRDSARRSVLDVHLFRLLTKSLQDLVVEPVLHLPLVFGQLLGDEIGRASCRDRE